MEANEIESTIIYCDESGYTGNSLLHPDQPALTYSAVELTPSSAHELVTRVRVKTRSQSAELKGNTLLKTPKGRAAILDILTETADHCAVAFFHKQYAMCGKIFEYLVEPIVSEISLLFYGQNFHRFIANALYMESLVQGTNTLDFISKFHDALRSRSIDELLGFGKCEAVIPITETVADKLLLLMTVNRERISREVKESSVEAGKTWFLELCTTALQTLLVHFSADMRPLDVLCDESQAIKLTQHHLNAIGNHTERQSIEIAGREHQLVYRLAAPIQFGSSHEHDGLQIADLLAAGVRFALQGTDPDFSQSAHPILNRILLNEACVTPDLDFCDLSDPDVFINSVLLEKLHRNGIRGLNPVSGIIQLYQSLLSDRDNGLLPMATLDN